MSEVIGKDWVDEVQRRMESKCKCCDRVIMAADPEKLTDEKGKLFFSLSCKSVFYHEETPTNQYNPDYAVHPGKILREYLAALPIETRNSLDAILALDCFGIMIEADSVSNKVAKQLAELFGTSEELWINLQKQWDERNNAENS